MTLEQRLLRSMEQAVDIAEGRTAPAQAYDLPADPPTKKTVVLKDDTHLDHKLDLVPATRWSSGIVALPIQEHKVFCRDCEIFLDPTTFTIR
jgi:hypothetical protein